MDLTPLILSFHYKARMMREVQQHLPISRDLSLLTDRLNSLSYKIEAVHHDSMEVHDTIVGINAQLKMMESRLDKLLDEKNEQKVIKK